MTLHARTAIASVRDINKTEATAYTTNDNVKPSSTTLNLRQAQAKAFVLHGLDNIETVTPVF